MDSKKISAGKLKGTKTYHWALEKYLNENAALQAVHKVEAKEEKGAGGVCLNWRLSKMLKHISY